MELATGIGFFQLDNLVRNKVPFILLSEELPFEEIFLGPALTQVREMVLPFRADEPQSMILEKLSLRDPTQSAPVVVLTRDEVTVQSWVKFLVDRGFLNVYFVEGGFPALKSEAIL